MVQKWTRKWSKSGPKSDPKSDPKSVTDWNRSPFAARGLELVKGILNIGGGGFGSRKVTHPLHFHAKPVPKVVPHNESGAKNSPKGKTHFSLDTFFDQNHWFGANFGRRILNASKSMILIKKNVSREKWVPPFGEFFAPDSLWSTTFGTGFPGKYNRWVTFRGPKPTPLAPKILYYYL